ncbi:hypothetical protein AOQ71_34405 [Bradyrhizobium manausense]|uniref:Uncharacterized protein n=1 Tax=Bradyrhizobium manausense TaxID=989370 RepID=A0A0R3CZI6_9BRAD|nr:hypothetical protein AOQ71_34405 [Bradyrhizobium manausense]
MAAVAPREDKRLEQPRQPLIEDEAAVPAGLVAERASNPAFADAGWADDEQVLMPVDPLWRNPKLDCDRSPLTHQA